MVDSALKTPVFDFEAGDFITDSQGIVKTTTGKEAVAQIIIKAGQTSRGLYILYANPEDAERHHKYGSDAWAVLADNTISDDVRLSELKRVIREVILYDPWVKNVSEVNITSAVSYDGTTMWYADLTVVTIWDEQIPVEGVSLNG